MTIDRYTKVMLTVIALSLALIAMRPLFSPTPSYAARAIEYKLVSHDGRASLLMEKELQQLGKEGWELVWEIYGSFVLKR